MARFLMTPKEAIAALDALTDADPEASHGEADEIILSVLRNSDDRDMIALGRAFAMAQVRVGFLYA